MSDLLPDQTWGGQEHWRSVSDDRRGSAATTNMGKYTKHEKVQFAKQMKRRPTKAERALWNVLMRKRLGLHFVAQAVLFGYIADFCCFAERLIVEVDGSIHKTEKQTEWDKTRDSVFKANRYRVLRFSNEEVLADPKSVGMKIRANFTKTGWGKRMSCIDSSTDRCSTGF